MMFRILLNHGIENYLLGCVLFRTQKQEIIKTHSPSIQLSLIPITYDYLIGFAMFSL